MRIAAFAWELHPSSQCRAFQPMRELSRRGHRVSVYGEDGLQPDDDELQAIVESFDVAYFARYTQVEAQELARTLREAGVAVVWDHDDDVIVSRKGSSDPEERQLIADIAEMMAIADVVTTTNERLAERYREEGAGCVIPVPNFVARESMDAPKPRHEGVVLGYIGWNDHQADWDRLGLAPVVRSLLDVHPQLRVESVGPVDFGLPEERYRRTGAVPFNSLPPAIAGFDIGIAPLMDIPGNRSRSDIKVKEYAIAGVPWLASPIGPYAELGEDEGGRLVADDDWHEQIERLVTDDRGRRKLAKRAAKWARRQTLPANVGIWEGALLEAIELADERREATWR
jgi:SAM-dependent methyltransferase